MVSQSITMATYLHSKYYHSTEGVKEECVLFNDALMSVYVCCMCVCMYIYIYMCVCVYICMSVYIYIYIYIYVTVNLYNQVICILPDFFS